MNHINFKLNQSPMILHSGTDVPPPGTGFVVTIDTDDVITIDGDNVVYLD